MARKPMSDEPTTNGPSVEAPPSVEPVPFPLIMTLSPNAKLQILKAFDFAARRDGVAGEPLDEMNLQLRTFLSA
jgi:hypothetical protein